MDVGFLYYKPPSRLLSTCFKCLLLEMVKNSSLSWSIRISTLMWIEVLVVVLNGLLCQVHSGSLCTCIVFQVMLLGTGSVGLESG